MPIKKISIAAVCFFLGLLGEASAQKSFRDCPDCPEMVAIPGGSFMMGCPDGDSSCAATEKPGHKVTVNAFAAGKYDVTVQEWEAFVKATNRPMAGGCAWTMVAADSGVRPWDLNPRANWRNLGFDQGGDHPVVCISWTDARDYIKWLSDKTGFQYRLLTESEWEYAARAGSRGAFPWTGGISHDMANYGSDSCCHPLATGKDRWLYTSPCGAFPPNAFGLYDMYGNILQYVEDYLAGDYTGAPVDGSAYRSDTTLRMTGRFAKMSGLRSGQFRIVRGGDWGDPPGMLRVSARNWAPGPRATLENYRSAGVGFRIARPMTAE